MLERVIQKIGVICPKWSISFVILKDMTEFYGDRRLCVTEMVKHVPKTRVCGAFIVSSYK